METKNAIIQSATISNEDHGCLTIWLSLNYGGSGQGFGGYSLYTPHKEFKATGNYAGLFIWKVMEVADVSIWNDVVGKTIRVNADHGKVHEIGHIVKDIWFNPTKEFQNDL